MATTDPTTRERPRWRPPTNGHVIVAVSEWLPGEEPTDDNIDLTDGRPYETRYCRCRKCGQERTHRDGFVESCAVDRHPNPIIEGGYSVEDTRTRRALTEDMTVRFGERVPVE